MRIRNTALDCCLYLQVADQSPPLRRCLGWGRPAAAAARVSGQHPATKQPSVNESHFSLHTSIVDSDQVLFVYDSDPEKNEHR